MRRAFAALSKYSNEKATQYDRQVEARTFQNIKLKQKSFLTLKSVSQRKAYNRDAVYMLQRSSTKALKRNVFAALDDHKNLGSHKMLQNERARELFRRRTVSAVFSELKKQMLRIRHGDQLSKQWQRYRVRAHFEAWLECANLQILGRGGNDPDGEAPVQSARAHTSNTQEPRHQSTHGPQHSYDSEEEYDEPRDDQGGRDSSDY